MDELPFAAAKMDVLEGLGVTPRGYVVLPTRCWTDNYYRPLREGFDEFFRRQGHSKEARGIVKSEKEESTLYEKYRGSYSYGVYVARKLGKERPRADRTPLSTKAAYKAHISFIASSALRRHVEVQFPLPGRMQGRAATEGLRPAALARQGETRLLSGGRGEPAQTTGQPELRTLLSYSHFDSLRARIRLSHHISPMSLEETASYIDHGLEVVHRTEELFSDAAKMEIFKRTNGIARWVNRICYSAIVAVRKLHTETWGTSPWLRLEISSVKSEKHESGYTVNVREDVLAEEPAHAGW